VNLRPRKSEEPDVNITSLIDVVLMLLVFFMLSSTFIKNDDIQIQLPKSTAPSIKVPNKTVVVRIDAKGHYYIDGKRLESAKPEAFKKTLAAAAGGHFNRPLTIRADARTTHQSVVTAMDVAGQLGFVQLNIVTTHPNAPSGG
jgi:biopolymer transport protein ExbD